MLRSFGYFIAGYENTINLPVHSIRDQIIEAIALFHARAGYALVIIDPGIDPFRMIGEKRLKMLALSGETVFLFVLLGGYAGIRGHTDSFTIAGNVIT
jgi:hypothetical protein